MKISAVPFAATALLTVLPTLAMAQSGAIAQTEQSDIATLPPSNAHRVFTLDSTGQAGVTIQDGDTLKMLGSIPAVWNGILTLDPGGKFFYVAETIYTKDTRGTRQDMVTVYDSSTLNPVTEIPLSGRMIMGELAHVFDISATGKYGYVYNMQPASSMIVLDLERRKAVTTVELPGCALAFPWKDGGFASLCGDGSLANVVLGPHGAKPTITHTQPFFPADSDPIYEQSLVDRASGKAMFLSYTGKIYAAQLGATPSIDTPWSITESAGMPVAGTGVQELAWRPGGSQPIAWHKAKNRLYVLMHPGNHWTHREPGTELWIIDATAHKTLKRLKMSDPQTSVAVSQDAKPLIYVLNRDKILTTYDEETGGKRDTSKFAIGRVLWVPGF